MTNDQFLKLQRGLKLKIRLTSSQPMANPHSGKGEEIEIDHLDSNILHQFHMVRLKFLFLHQTE